MLPSITFLSGTFNPTGYFSKWILTFLLLLGGTFSFAQNSSQYAFYTSGSASLAADRSGNAIDMSTGTSQIVGAGIDDGASSIINIGFSFPFMGSNQTQFSASSNGIIRFGSSAVSTTQYTFPNGNQLLVAPYVGDLKTSSSGKVHYKLIGSSPNRVLVVEFLNMSINYSSSGANGTFQARLYESGIVEFVYGNMSVGGTTNTKTTLIGFSQNTSNNNLISVNQSSYVTSTSSTTIKNTNSSNGNITGLNSVANGSRRSFTFIPNGYKSQFISISYGTGTWCAGEARNVTVVIKNIGTDSWSDVGKDINIGLKWNVDADYGASIPRVDAAGLLPGATGTYVFTNVVAPAGANVENLTSDVVYEGVSWFAGNASFVGPGNTVLKSSDIILRPAPVSVTGGTGCGSKLITASGGSGGTIYFQGTTSGGTSTATASTSETITASGTYYFRSQAAGGCWGDEGSAVVTINTPPVIDVNPVSEVKCSGNSVTFSVSASGPNLTYQWRKNGSNIAGAINNSYTISSVSPADGANYDVVVSNAGCTNVTSDIATLTVHTPPSISAQPQTLALCEGADANFSVSANGTPVLTYQWMKEGVNISGEISSTFSISAISSSDAASYSVKITNGCGNLVSNAANLVVNTPPSITTSPVSSIKCAGSAVTFSVVAAGTNLTYQWRKNGSNISGATNNTFTISSVAPGDAANYDAVVSNAGCINATSAIAVLTVNSRPFASIVNSSITKCSQEITTISGNLTASGAWTVSLSDGQHLSGSGNSAISFTVNPSNNITYTLSTLSDELCSSISSDLTGSVNITTNPLPGAVSAIPASQIICNGGAANLTANGSITQNGVAFSDNFNGTVKLNSAGTASGDRSQIWTKENSGSNVNSSGTFTSPTGGGMMIAMSAAAAILGQSTSTVNSTLTSSAIAVNNYNALTLTFKHTYNKANTSGSANVEISNNGTSWSSLKSYGGNVGGATSFSSESIAIPAIYLNQPIYIRFNYQASGKSSFFGTHSYWWGIDDVEINGNLIPLFSWTASTGAGINGLPAGAGTPSVANKSLVVSPSQSTNYNLTVTNPATGCNSNAALSVVVNDRPTGVISGSFIYCRGENTSSVFAVAVTGSGTISGTLSDGTVFSGTAPTIIAHASPINSTTYTIATLNDANCSATASDLSGTASVTIKERPTAVISGGGTYCADASTTTQLSIAVTGVGSISGTLSDGTMFSGTAPTITVNVTPVSTTTYTIATMSDASCTSNPSDFSGSATVTVNPLPAAIVITPAAPVICAGSNVVLSASSPSSTFSWSPSEGLSATTGSSVTASPSATTIYLVTATNSFGCTTSNSVTVTVTPALIVGAAITGPSNACLYMGEGSNLASYSIEAENAADYNWILPAGALNVTGQSTNTISFNYPMSFTSGSVQVNVIAGPGCESINRSISIGRTIPSAPTVSGIVNVCNYVGTGVELTYTAVPDPNVSSYLWTVPPTTTIVSGQGTNSINVTLQPGFTSSPNKQIRVRSIAACGQSELTIYYLKVEFPVTPGFISGATEVCSYKGTSTPVTYTIGDVISATGYLWTVPTGATIVGAANGTSINVVFGNSYTGGSITARAVNSCGTSGARSIVVKSTTPSVPGPISGPNNICSLLPSIANPAGLSGVYSVSTKPGFTYVWTVPEGIIIDSHSNTSTEDMITVSFNSSYSGGSISVHAQNECGVSAERVFNLSQLTPGAVGGILEISQGSCPGRTYSYGVSSMPTNATSLEWTVPAGATIISGQGTTNITVSYPDEALSGVISALGNNGCGDSYVARTFNIKLSACAPAQPMVKGDVKATPEVVGDKLEVRVYPNPSVTTFKLYAISNNSKEVMNVRIVDNLGREFKRLQMKSGETISFGSELKAGSYFIEVIQGKIKTVNKIIKY